MNTENSLIVLALPEQRIPQDAQKRLQDRAAGRKVMIVTDKGKLDSLLDQIEIVGGEFPPPLIARSPNLKWYQSWYAGADWLQKFPETKTHPFVLTNSSGIHGVQMSEHLFGMLISWYRKFPAAFTAQGRHEWLTFTYPDMDVLAGKTMLIIGYGTIGKRVARIAQAFEMKVVGVKRSPATEQDPYGATQDVFANLNKRLAEADIVVNILPLTAETKGLFNRTIFQAMKKDAIFVNIGRGGSVNEEDLVDALKKGTIKGALLDVTVEEPLPASSPLWDLPNLMLTSHFSGFHPQYDELAFQVFLENLERYNRGESLRNVIDKNLGY
ncbi:D-2-hydroxyacid dehydrogenase [Gracilinema caldarium]|uniref:D-2-hydroxyacid dehydrogenase n=1 Tax=Gracilinema caldarium TaxID=215591 RepID=UPI0026EFA51F|nr:D-2-hydroxyacid dehydrogenase [Gracilinema caldarium]